MALQAPIAEALETAPYLHTHALWTREAEIERRQGWQQERKSWKFWRMDHWIMITSFETPVDMTFTYILHHFTIFVSVASIASFRCSKVGILSATKCGASIAMHRGCGFGLWTFGVALQRFAKSSGAKLPCVKG